MANAPKGASGGIDEDEQHNAEYDQRCTNQGLPSDAPSVGPDTPSGLRSPEPLSVRGTRDVARRLPRNPPRGKLRQPRRLEVLRF